jgi:hypothetical protein
VTAISFIGNAGGLLGLFLGLSFVSVFEIVYFVSEFILQKFVASTSVFKK